MNAGDEAGLGLFDEMASAAGNFPTALRGYDRTAVDDYVRTLEASVVESRRRASQLQAGVDSLNEQLETAKPVESVDVDYSELGGRATEILRLAEEQAREMLDRASVDAEKTREDARREADSVRQHARREQGELKSTGQAELDRLRSQLESDASGEVERAQAEAAALVAAARRQGAALLQQAEHDAQAARQGAYLDTEELRRAVEREAATTRQQVAEEREQALAQLRAVHEDAVQRTSALLTEATAHTQASADRLEADITEATRIRTEALAEAEQVKLAAAREAEEKVQAAKKLAASINDRTQHEFSWRKQQLKRDTDLLTQRKQAVLNQLASLSALAQQTMSSFPDVDQLGDFDGEEGDQTVLRGPIPPPTGRPQAERESGPESIAAAPDAEAEAAELGAAGRDPQGPKPDELDPDATRRTGLPIVDGDTTIMVPVGGPPAGTAHRASGQRDDTPDPPR